MRRNGVIEFGDLITLPVRLLEQDNGLRANLRSEFKHVLVDEFQDVNHASARLVKALAPTGEGLWVVGDARQAIYRFRGASPENVIKFSDDYPTSRELDLSVNYRSLPQIVTFVSHLAKDLEGENSEREHWLASRADSHGRIELHAAPGFDEQDALLVEAIRQRQAEGYSLSQQAVLVRSNREAERFASMLEEAGVASLRTGDPLENSRVRDLLALVSFCVESRSPAAYRVGQLFGLRPETVSELLRLSSEGNITGLEAARQLAQSSDDPSLASLLTSLSHYSGYETAATLLLRLLFAQASPFASVVLDGSPKTTSDRQAVYALLAFAAVQRPPKKAKEDEQAASRVATNAPSPGTAGRTLLKRIRRQMAGNSKSSLTSLELPETLDGVRVLTMHGAKGLEFPVVYLPNLHSPARDRKDTEAKLPLPQGIIRTTDEAEDTEENRLFFVAASRARDFLWMCVPARPSKPPEPHAVLHRARPALEAAGVPWPEWEYFAGSEKQRPERESHPAEPQRLTIRALSDYERCPRTYHYRHVLRLPEPQIDAIYPRLIALLRTEWKELLSAQKQGNFFDAGLAIDRLRARWDAERLGDTPLGKWYLQRGERAIVAMPLQASELIVSEGDIELEARLGDDLIGLGKVAVVRDDAGALVAETAGGSANGNSAEQNMLALAMAERFPNEQAVGSRQRSITKGEVSKTRSLASARRSNAALFQKAREGIGAERFDAQPDDRVCPSCPFLFICPS
jgi:superfamily I DNA/RNA helicase